MAIVGRFRKHPGDSLDYILDYASWLNGDTIATSTFVLPPGLSSGGTATNTTTTATAWIAGGEAGRIYTVKHTMVSANSPARTKVVTFELEVVP